MTQAVCVITPCFNAAPFLRQALESIAAQGDCLARHIVMDGASTDGSVEILRQFSASHPKLLWHSERDEGQSDALQKSLARVDTEYFAWINADDCLRPGGLRALLRGLTSARHPPAIVYGDYDIIDEQGHVLRRRRQPSFNYWDCLFSYLTVQNCAAIFNTAKVRETGGFDRSLQFCMDYDLVLRLARSGPVRHVREYVGCFRHHEGAKTAQLQTVCALETQQLRLKFSGLSPNALRWRFWIGKARVAARMTLQGCIGSRLMPRDRHPTALTA